VSEWDASMITAWAKGLSAQRGSEWAEKAAAVLSEHGVVGAQLPKLIQREGLECLPSAALVDMCATAGLEQRQLLALAVAVGSLLQKGYFSSARSDSNAGQAHVALDDSRVIAPGHGQDGGGDQGGGLHASQRE
jgi:hypothetical protein